MSIKFYSHKGKYGFFSNFYESPVTIDGKEYKTTEHYFQAMKYEHNNNYFNKIVNAPSPAIAAKLGRNKNVPIRNDWEDIKNDVMLKCLRHKFDQHKNLKILLINTHNKQLIEHTINDSYWGDGGDGTGKNMLGKLLMQIRNEYINEKN